MKKIPFILLIIIMSIPIIACDDNDRIVYVPVSSGNSIVNGDALTIGTNAPLELDDLIVYTPNTTTDNYIEVYIVGGDIDVSLDGSSFTGTGPVVYIKYYGVTPSQLSSQNLQMSNICQVSYAKSVDMSASNAAASFINVAAGTMILTESNNKFNFSILGLDSSVNNIEIYFDDSIDDKFNTTSPFTISWSNSI